MQTVLMNSIKQTHFLSRDVFEDLLFWISYWHWLLSLVFLPFFIRAEADSANASLVRDVLSQTSL